MASLLFRRYRSHDIILSASCKAPSVEFDLFSRAPRGDIEKSAFASRHSLACHSEAVPAGAGRGSLNGEGRSFLQVDTFRGGICGLDDV